MMRWFDGHLDLACLAALGRDMLAPSLETCGGPHPPAGVTLGSLRSAGVYGALATIFTESGGNEPEIAYAPGDAEAAHAAGLRQLDIYDSWCSDGLACRLHDLLPAVFGPPMLRIGILIEGADPIRSPEELAWWKERGVVAVGMAWWKSSRYAGGNGSDEGISDLGRLLVAEIDRIGVLHDASHLSDRALADLFQLTDRCILASHSNCRAIAEPGNQRHLTDEAAREIIRRGGVIGLNLFGRFLVQGRPATIDDCVAHVEHFCGLAGHARCVGLGSDIDGGFSADQLPEGLRSHADLGRLCDALRDRGWNDEAVEGFAWRNWARLLNVEPPTFVEDQGAEA